MVPIGALVLLTTPPVLSSSGRFLSGPARQKPSPSARSDITVEQMVEGEFDAEPPSLDGTWRPDGRSVIQMTPGGEVDSVDAATGQTSMIIPGADLRDDQTKLAIHPEECQLTPDGQHALLFVNSQRVWRLHTRGDYFVWTAGIHSVRRLGGDAPASSLMFAKFSPDGSRVGYVFDHNVYVEDVASGKRTALTHDGSPTVVNGTSDWVYEEELDIRDAWQWSPDGRYIAYWHFDTSPEPIYTLINDTDSLYPTLLRYPYPIAGEANANVRVGVVSADGGLTVWMKDTANSANGYIARSQWTPMPGTLLIQHLNRAQNEDRYLVADARTGDVRTVFVDTDPKYVDIMDTGPGGVRWLDHGTAFLVYSDRRGWRQLFAVPLGGGPAKCLTPEPFDVDQVRGTGSGEVYFTASPSDATQRYLYSAPADGTGRPRRITPEGDAGTNEYDLAPDARFAIHTRSRVDLAPVHELIELPSHRTVRSLGDNAALRDRMKTVRLGPIERSRFPAADGEAMDALLTFPPGFDAHRKYPVLVYVYGEPAGTVVTDEWSGYTFDRIVAERGYIVMRVDNRGTPALKGVAWRKAAYRKIGVLASADQAAAIREFAKRPYVDGSCVAVWGWSGGGSMTLNLMFRHPELYRVGMAVAPVPDIHLYDTIYQERYMGRPQDHEADYVEDSPITFANGLRGSLLIVHGSGDDNVHYAGTERLVNALVAGAKPFQLMVYPNRTHSLSQGIGTQRHLYELLLQFLTAHLPTRP